MDLCWEQEKYQQILDLYGRFKDFEGRPTKYPRDIITLVAASCFKLVSINCYEFWNRLLILTFFVFTILQRIHQNLLNIV